MKRISVAARTLAVVPRVPAAAGHRTSAGYRTLAVAVLAPAILGLHRAPARGEPASVAQLA